MKTSVKTILDSIEKEIEYVKENSYLFEDSTYQNRDFEFGNFDFEIDTYIKNEIGGEWDEFLSSERITIIVTKVTVTNKNCKVLTNLSNEVFNQLETTYTNY